MKAAVVGAGAIARQHLGCLRTLPGVDTAAVCDLSPAVAESVAERFELPAWFTNYEVLLSDVRPDVVHVTTPPGSHYALALAALRAGAHVVVEKPIASRPEEISALIDAARKHERLLIEDYNYLFNSPIRQIAAHIERGEFGAVTHVDAFICVDSGGNPQAPAPGLPGGTISDYLPHLAALAHFFVGAHVDVCADWRTTVGSAAAPDELRALVAGERGSATLGFSARSQPDGFWVQVYGTRMRAVANLYAARLTMDRLRDIPRPLQALVNSLNEARDLRRSAVGSLWQKIAGGPGTYEGLWRLLREIYASLQAGSPPPITLSDVASVNALSYAVHERGKLV